MRAISALDSAGWETLLSRAKAVADLLEPDTRESLIDAIQRDRSSVVVQADGDRLHLMVGNYRLVTARHDELHTEP